MSKIENCCQYCSGKGLLKLGDTCYYCSGTGRKTIWVCSRCGRDTFAKPSPHKCRGGFTKKILFSSCTVDEKIAKKLMEE